MQKINLEDKLWNANYNGPLPLTGSLMGNNFNNFNFKQKNSSVKSVNNNNLNYRNGKENININKSTSFLNKKD